MPIVPGKFRGFLRVAIPLFALTFIGAGVLLKMENRPPAAYINVDLLALGYFPFDQTSGKLADVPARWRALDGQKVHLQGFMYAPASDPSITSFQLVYRMRDDSGRGPPLVQERVFAKSPRPFKVSDNFVDVYGTLHVDVKHDAKSGEVAQVFALDTDRVSIVDTAIDPTRANWVEPQRVTIGREFIFVGAFLFALAALRELLLFLRRYSGRQRAKRNICPVCGYDLRASPERCPECGTVAQH